MRSGHFRNGERIGESITYDQRAEPYKLTSMGKK
jgi:hypothetical protein